MFRTSCPPPPLFPLTSSVHLPHHLSIPSSPSLSSTPDQREKERETRLQELRQQREERSQKGRTGAGAGEVVMRKMEKSADGSSLSQVTKTDRFAQSGSFFFWMEVDWKTAYKDTDPVQYVNHLKCVFVCLDNGNTSTRSTVVEASYVQKTDSESLLYYFALQLPYCTVLSLQNDLCMSVYLFIISGGTVQSKSYSYSSSTSSSAANTSKKVGR